MVQVPSLKMQLVSLCPTMPAFASEAPFLAVKGVDTEVMGTGSIDQAHQCDEYSDLAQIEPLVAIIRALMTKHCLA